MLENDRGTLQEDNNHTLKETLQICILSMKHYFNTALNKDKEKLGSSVQATIRTIQWSQNGSR